MAKQARIHSRRGSYIHKQVCDGVVVSFKATGKDTTIVFISRASRIDAASVSNGWPAGVFAVGRSHDACALRGGVCVVPSF